MVILKTLNKITDFLMILAWASPFNRSPIVTARYATSTAHSLLCIHKADEYGTMPGQRLIY